MQIQNEALTKAFQILSATVQDFTFRGWRCLGATLKPKLRERQVNENLLGFIKFGDFLRAAQSAGYITLSRTPGDEDFEIGLGSIKPLAAEAVPAALTPSPSVTPPSIMVTTSSTAPIRVRQDLWNAFNSFADGWVYDSTTDRAVKDTHRISLLAPHVISIPPGRERVPEWMREFADIQQDSEIKVSLSAALSRNIGLYEFNRLAREKGISREWGRFHVQSMLAAIEAWAASNRVRPSNVASSMRPSFALAASVPPAAIKPPEVSAAIIPPTPPPPQGTHSSTSSLNNRLAYLIDALINDLIALRGLLQIAGPQA